MKIQVERDVLAEAVQWAARSLPTRPSVPILLGLLIEAHGNQVVLSSFDYETAAKATIAATVTDEGTVLVQGRLLADITRQLPNRPVELSTNGAWVELVCGSSRFTLQSMTATDYPSLPTMPDATGSVPSADFADAVSQVVVAAGRDELLPVFTGVRVEFENDTLSLLATDRYRMALKELVWNPVASKASGAALVPGKVLADTAKSMTSGEKVTVSLSATAAGDGIIGFEGEGPGGTRQITTRLLDGEFPKLRHIMNINAMVEVRANTADLVAAVKRVALVAERNTSVRMEIGEEDVTLRAATADQAQASERIEAAVKNIPGGEPALTAAGFNPHYLLDALSVLEAPFVQFDFTAPGKPCLVRGLPDMDSDPLPDYRHVIMLMRLPN